MVKLLHHNNYFSSFESAEIEFNKLDTPTNITYRANSTTIYWDSVDGADGYIVKVIEDGQEDKCYPVTEPQWEIAGVKSNAFRIQVKAVSKAMQSNIINSNYSTEYSIETPHQVDVTTFRFDEELQAFIWKPINLEQSNDKYYLGYQYDAGESVNPIRKVIDNNKDFIMIDGDKYYCYYPYIIGTYRMIYVQVERGQGLSSQPTYCIDDATGQNYVLNFNIFASGDGSTTSPYVIKTETQLRNIKYFLNANYKLGDNILLERTAPYTFNAVDVEGNPITISPITNVNQVLGGTLNGAGYSIGGLEQVINAGFDNNGYVGLFTKTKNATFEDVTLSGFKINGNVSSVNTLYLGILVADAENTTFEGVKITSSEITVNKTAKTGDSIAMYVGLVVGKATSSGFYDCQIAQNKINSDIRGNANTSLSVGGIIGYASNSCDLYGNVSNGEIVYGLSVTTESSGGTISINHGLWIGCSENGGAYLANNHGKFKTERDNTERINEIGYEKS